MLFLLRVEGTSPRRDVVDDQVRIARRKSLLHIGYACIVLPPHPFHCRRRLPLREQTCSHDDSRI